MSAFDRIERLRAAKRGAATSTHAAPALRRQLEAERQGAEIDEAERLHVRRVLAMLEIAFLAAAADGELSDIEALNLGVSLCGWLGGDIEVDVVNTLLDRFAGLLRDEGFEARLSAAARALDPESRREAYDLVCAVVACDIDVRQEELGVLGDIAGALEIPEDEAQAQFDEIHGAIQQAAAAPPPA